LKLLVKNDIIQNSIITNKKIQNIERRTVTKFSNCINMSLLSDIAVPVAKLVNAKKGNEKAMENPRRDTDFFNKKYFNKEFLTDEEFIDGFQIITVKTEKSLNKHIIFLHGGGYVLRAVRSHKNIVERMVKKYNLKVTFVDYPLAPEYTIDKAHDVLMKAYKSVSEKNKEDANDVKAKDVENLLTPKYLYISLEYFCGKCIITLFSIKFSNINITIDNLSSKSSTNVKSFKLFQVCEYFSRYGYKPFFRGTLLEFIAFFQLSNCLSVNPGLASKLDIHS